MKRLASVVLIIAAGTLSAQVTLNTLRAAAANTWIAVPSSRMDAVDPCPAHNCNYSAVEGVSAVMNDWCGGAYDSKRDRLVVWGGGHNGYYGNELYAFDVPTLKWARLNQPSTQLNLCQEVQGDGLPCSRHTYGGLAYIAHTDQYFGKGGAWACPGGNGGCLRTWVFDFANGQWSNKNPSGNMSTFWGDAAAYDPKSKKVWFLAGSSSSSSVWGLHSYDPAVNQWTKHNSDAAVNGAMAVDTSRGLLFMVGSSKLLVYNISTGSPVAQSWTTTGDLGLISSKSYGLGLDYDPVADKIVGWHGGSVYALDPATKVWTSYNPTGAPSQNPGGTYGRWRYSPLVNAFVSANFTNQNVYFYKLSAGAGTGKEAEAARTLEKSFFISPNPSYGAATIALNSATGGKAAKAVLYDLQGRLVTAFFAGRQWRVEGINPGVYLFSATVEGKNLSRKMVVLE